MTLNNKKDSQTANKNLTIKDIARMSKMSIGTISRVINNSGPVSEPTRNKVNEIIRQTNYLPNNAAKSMVNKKSGIIGIIVPDISNPFLCSHVDLLHKFFSDAGFSVMLCNSGYNNDNVVNFTNNLIQRNAEGVVFISSYINDEKQISLIKSKLKVVLISSSFGGFDSVSVADWQSAFDVVEYLVSAGHKHIACIGYNDTSPPTMERYRGYCDAMKKNGFKLNKNYQVPADNVISDLHQMGYTMAKKLLDLPVPPTAIFVINDYYAINAYFAVKEKGLIVGKDISIAGYHDIDICQLVKPSLTTVKCQVDTLTSLAADILLKKIQEEDSGEVKSILLTGELVIRESVAVL